ncbi:MAG: diaminopimelate decarboxylase, partial [Kangiellaceae bacterium]|nr:diaminopimelate decarboxylase [Kangiellaceae bacterium]
MRLKNLVSQFESLETPFYHYDLDLLKQTVSEVKELAEKYDFDIHYAVKANSNERILSELNDAGFGADCVSGNEVKLASKVGFSSESILFAGVGKTDKEINIALDLNIKAFNCESTQEIEVLNDLAGKQNKVAEISLRINPNVDAKTHKYITTGLDENKFGINQVDLEVLVSKLPEWKNINLTGLHFHIGSQITDMNVFKGLCLRVNELQNWFEDNAIKIEHLNLGGGLGINYLSPDEESIPEFKTYFGIFNEFLERKPGQKVHFELGRSIVGQCGSLITRVVFIKNGINTDFAIVDAGMTELMRPALYQSYHQIENLSSEGEVKN